MATPGKLPSGKYQFIIRVVGHILIFKAFNKIAVGSKWAKSVEF